MNDPQPGMLEMAEALRKHAEARLGHYVLLDQRLRKFHALVLVDFLRAALDAPGALVARLLQELDGMTDVLAEFFVVGGPIDRFDVRGLGVGGAEAPSEGLLVARPVVRVEEEPEAVDDVEQYHD